jgi:hypothetical protein
MIDAPEFEDAEIGLVGLASGWGLGCTDEVVGLLDEVFEAPPSSLIRISL